MCKGVSSGADNRPSDPGGWPRRARSGRRSSHGCARRWVLVPCRSRLDGRTMDLGAARPSGHGGDRSRSGRLAECTAARSFGRGWSILSADSSWSRLGCRWTAVRRPSAAPLGRWRETCCGGQARSTRWGSLTGPPDLGEQARPPSGYLRLSVCANVARPRSQFRGVGRSYAPGVGRAPGSDPIRGGGGFRPSGVTLATSGVARTLALGSPGVPRDRSGLHELLLWASVEGGAHAGAGI